jgi:putative tricarboxylic transport membrane protein
MTGPAPQIWRRSDMIIGLVLLAFGLGATFLALDISQGPQQRTLPPNTVPLICTVGIVLCGLALIGRGLTVPQKAIALPFDLRQVLTAVCFFAFFLLFEHVDFRLLITSFVAITMWLLGCRSWKQLVIVPLATTAGIWVFFVKLFSVFLPTWI